MQQLGSSLAPSAFHALPLGAVRPSGWLLEQLRLQADGLTGHLEELWPNVGLTSAWLGGDGEDWELGPYYCDGLVPLAYLLRDERLIVRAERWVESVLAGQRESGQFGPRSNEDWWPRMVMLKALDQYEEATGDPRVFPFMTRYFHYQLATLPERPLYEWGWMRGAENALSVCRLYEYTHDDTLLQLADLLLAQTMDWEEYLTTSLPTERQTTSDHLVHVVNIAMALKYPAIRYLRDGRAEHLRAIEAVLAALTRFHGQIHGMFSGDELLAGTDPIQGVELCAVVESMFSLEQILRIAGRGRFGDRLEAIAYNALPAAVTADVRAHQYHQQPNQVVCTIAPRRWTSSGDESNIFGLEPNSGCCTANMHQGWPKLAESLWMTSRDGLVAVAYAPSVVRTRLRDGTAIAIEESTEYPFEETVRFTIRVTRPVAFPIRLRHPQWCTAARLEVNGEEEAAHTGEDGFVTVRREWHDGDRMELVLPMHLRAWRRPSGGAGVALGPLIFVVEVGEEWTRIQGSSGFGDWEVRPTTPWNYALELDLDEPESTFHVERSEVRTPPFSQEQTAVRIQTQGHHVAGWGLVQNSAGPLPLSPVAAADPPEPVTLIPYGCARLRVAEFPYVDPNGR